jgi:cytochrome c-type biogenesis protein CcmE
MTESSAAVARAPRGSQRRWVAGGVLAAILGIFGWMTYGGMEENLVYFLTPKELHAKGTKAYGRPVRLGGQVVPGSVQWNAEALDLRFRVTDGEREVLVHSSGAPPQMFRAGIGVVVEGKYGKNAVFESKSLMVKHSNEYKAPEAGSHPPRLDKTLIRPSA